MWKVKRGAKVRNNVSLPVDSIVVISLLNLILCLVEEVEKLGTGGVGSFRFRCTRLWDRDIHGSSGFFLSYVVWRGGFFLALSCCSLLVDFLYFSPFCYSTGGILIIANWSFLSTFFEEIAVAIVPRSFFSTHLLKDLHLKKKKN